MSGTTLIIWGGNQKLAYEVANELKKNDQNAEIGGGSQRNTYVGTQVINQINQADKIMILAQWPPENEPELINEPIQFRPNLMYEWGYVNARFPAEDVQVFVIGMTQNDLPTDLKGIWVEEIPLSDIDTMAKQISSQYIRKESTTDVDLEDIFISWSKTKDYLGSIIRGDINFNHIRVANLILHSIQPAYYNNDIAFLRNVIKERIPSNSNDLLITKEIAITVTEFYEVTSNQLRTPSLSDLKNIKDGLEFPVTASDAKLEKWLNLIRLDFLGLCNMFLGNLKEDPKEKEHYYRLAVKNFEDAYEILVYLQGAKIRSGYFSLWKGYILRNQGKILCSLGIKEEGYEKLQAALEGRRLGLRTFKSLKTPDLLLTHLELEMYLVEIELARFGMVNSDYQLFETIESLKRFNKPFDLWKLIITEARTLANESDNSKVADEINKLYELL